MRRRVIDADEGLRAYEHRFMLRAQDAIAEAIARDLGVAPGDLEPRMAAAATLTVFYLLGEGSSPADAARRSRPSTARCCSSARASARSAA